MRNSKPLLIQDEIDAYLAAVPEPARGTPLFAMNPAVMQQFEKELKNYRTSKGTIQFPHDKPLPATLGDS